MRSEHTKRLVSTVLIVVAIVAAYWGYTTSPSQKVREIVATHDLSLQQQHYRALLEQVGLERGQDMLETSGLPFDGQSHLLNHTAGEYAYEQFGNDGILHCRDYFLQSCYHGVVISLIANEGLAGFNEVMAHCRERGGEILAAQCAHGIGHGAVAFVRYDKLPEALELCDTLNERGAGFPLFHCYDGAFMENVWGVHEDGTPSPERWIDENNPLFPCTSSAIKEMWRSGCWANQASIMMQLFSGDIQKTANFCGNAPTDSYRELCLDGLARQIHPLASGNPEAIRDLCKETGDWNPTCIATVASSEYAVGGRDLPFQLCEAQAETGRSECYERLLVAIRSYSDQPSSCHAIPDVSYRAACISAF